MLKKILITGPESTGKSQLTQALARYYHSVYVKEYAREYIAALDRDYMESDLLIMAQKQIELEKQQTLEADDFLFCDTALTVYEIWSREKYGRTHPWIKQEIGRITYDLYLLCDVDLPWVEDPQRENPYDRDRLLSLYQQSFNERNIEYFMVRGKGDSRLKNAIEIIESKFKNVNT